MQIALPIEGAYIGITGNVFRNGDRLPHFQIFRQAQSVGNRDGECFSGIACCLNSYVEQVLPEKMKYNLEYVKTFGFLTDIKLMFKTVKEVVAG